MSIPSKPIQKYTSSRQLIAGADINSLSDQLNTAQSTTATGTTQATAAQINSANVEVKSGSVNNAGMILPQSFPGLEVDILNNSLNTTNLYPYGATDVIQNGGTTYAAVKTAVAMATLVSWRLKCIKTGFWQRIITS